MRNLRATSAETRPAFGKPSELRSPAASPGFRAGTAIKRRYTVQRPLARGGMGELFLGRDKCLNRSVVLKEPRCDFDPFRNRACQSSILAEGQILARLNHPFIVSIFDMYENGGRQGLVLEYVDGTPLDEVHDVPLAEVVGLGIEVAEALAHIHEHNIVHLDLKLENVLLTTQGTPCVIDFGIAQPPGRVRQLPGAAGVIGTPRVMAPEQLSGCDVDSHSDLFSLGIMLFELIAGTSPFAGKSDAEAISLVLGQRPPMVDSLQPGTPRALAMLIDQLLEKDPLRRPANANEVAARLATVFATL
jgi:serine/threonine-protein kinase